MSRYFIVIIFLFFSCSKEIGDPCSSNVDCGSNRICDTSQPGGYCTISPCRPGDCPSGSECIEFEPQISYCMESCSDSSQCRKGYVCVKGFSKYGGFCNGMGLVDESDITETFEQ